MDRQPTADATHTSARLCIGPLEVSPPVVLAPTAFQRLCHPEGEVATARGAGRKGHLMVASTLATTTVEEIAGAISEGASSFDLVLVIGGSQGAKALTAVAIDAAGNIFLTGNNSSGINLGGGELAFTVSTDLPWITLDPLSGTLLHGEDATVELGAGSAGGTLARIVLPPPSPRLTEGES